MLIKEIILLLGLHLAQQVLLQDALLIQIMSICLILSDNHLNCRGTRAQTTLIGFSLSQFLADPGISRVAIRGFCTQRLAFLGCNGGACLCKLLVHFLHQWVSGLVLGEQFSAFELEGHQGCFQPLQNLRVVNCRRLCGQPLCGCTGLLFQRIDALVVGSNIGVRLLQSGGELA